MNLFGSEGIGNPDREAAGLIKDLQHQIKGVPGLSDLPKATPIAVFLSNQVQLEVQDTPFPVLNIEKLKNHIRRTLDLPKPQQQIIEKFKNFLSE